MRPSGSSRINTLEWLKSPSSSLRNCTCHEIPRASSGFAGLVYQAIWSHYLGLSLGHAAYAQTLVLAIFMGGPFGEERGRGGLPEARHQPLPSPLRGGVRGGGPTG
jgi:hypothetical protein